MFLLTWLFFNYNLSSADHIITCWRHKVVILQIFFFWLHRKPVAEPEHNASLMSDASKKRLIEDTEDWHPRSGTSQSRSFHILAQITGTEKGVLRLKKTKCILYSFSYLSHFLLFFSPLQNKCKRTMERSKWFVWFCSISSISVGHPNVLCRIGFLNLISQGIKLNIWFSNLVF